MDFDSEEVGRSKVLGMLIMLLMAAFLCTPTSASEGGGMVENEQHQIDMVIIGASYAAGWKAETLAGMTVLNQGVGGQESSEVLARFERDVVAVRPRLVVIWGFINDIFRTERENLPTRMERTRNDLRAMVELARSNGIQPILATEVTTAEPAGFLNTLRGLIGRLRGKQSYARFVSDEVIAVNEWMRGYAAERGIPLLDIERLFAAEDGLRRRDYTADDGSHITPAGYQALTRYTDQHLPELLAQ